MPTAVRGNVVSHWDELPPTPSRQQRSKLPEHLSRRGFEVKMASYGNRQEPVVVDRNGRSFAPAMVYSGEYSNDAQLASYQRKMRATASSTYEKAFWRWPAFLVKSGGNRDMAFAMLINAMPEAKALVEGIDSSGGFWVPPDFSSDILSAVAEQSLMGLCTIRPAATDSLVIPKFQPASSSALGTQLGVAVVGETASGQTFADVHFSQIVIPVRRFRSIVRVSRDLLSDSPVALGQELADAFSRDLGSQINAQILTGPDFEPLLYHPAINTFNLQGGAAHTLDTSSDDRWRQLRSALPEQYRPGAHVFMSGTLQSGFDSETAGASGRPVATRHDDVQDRYMFDEVPLISSNWMPSYPPSALSPILLYGDLAQYTIAQRADVSLVITSETPAADIDAVDCVLVARYGGACVTPDGFRVGVL
jgi:HK97 family phage major capsid protein